ncbi:MAG: aminomethyl-transferring glycine dehydrogenase subunit GcvPB [Clostridiales bacterium]|nr:aminomethyl-transferring glycine dehydrogenase subunit GcvPB [Clostridiales bacterium]
MRDQKLQKLIFEKSREGRGCSLLPACDVPAALPDQALLRQAPPRLPQVAEIDISRHYTEMQKRTHGVNDGFYPLGSCTMKYNPKLGEEMAALPGFAGVHPLQPAGTAQGCLELLCRAEQVLAEITGMDAMTFQPAAGAHGEYLGLLLIKAYHQARGDRARNKIIVPDAAHGTNPATATMNGMQTVNIPSNEQGCVDLDKLRAAVGPDTAGLMLTNPNTLGLFDENIAEITRIVHEAGGLNYYDGANLNAIMGIARPGDMGFDVIHLNLHKSFATPHGGGGPGSGAVGCKALLAPFLPLDRPVQQGEAYGFEDPVQSIGRIKAFYGNFLVVVKALSYVLTLGAEGIREAACNAVLNANYLKNQINDLYEVAFDGICMHEFVLSLAELKKRTGVSAKDVAKALLDYDIHPPTMYFPLIVEEALMFEPTETEPREMLDYAAQVLREIHAQAFSDPAPLLNAPLTTPVARPDEVLAARSPRLTFEF